jgi:uncharacterized protein (DUF433 family)
MPARRKLRQSVNDPPRQFGEPVVRSVPTEVIAEQLRAGETLEGLAELFELSPCLVEAALRCELSRDQPEERAA